MKEIVASVSCGSPHVLARYSRGFGAEESDLVVGLSELSAKFAPADLRLVAPDGGG
jgi:hypothetical protein